tara:strand:- start:413 stop:640 length:228 start_codon:yes stop_codon:yes gene_type:complete
MSKNIYKVNFNYEESGTFFVEDDNGTSAIYQAEKILDDKASVKLKDDDRHLETNHREFVVTSVANTSAREVNDGR